MERKGRRGRRAKRAKGRSRDRSGTSDEAKGGVRILYIN